MTAASEFRRWWVLAAALSGIGGVALTWALAHPAGPSPSATFRVLADCLGALVLGLGVLGTGFFRQRAGRPIAARNELWRPIALAGACWLLAEIGVLTLVASASFGSTVDELPVGAFGNFLSHITVGQLGIVAVVCTSAICVYGAGAFRFGSSWSTVPIIVFASITLVVRPITGHMSQQAFGSILVSAHALAASLWLGVLTALALTIRSRGHWAVVLPQFSRLALWCVVVIAVTGVVTALVKVGGIDGFIDTGYGRIVLAKVALLAILVYLASRIRLSWLPSAIAHRVAAQDSLVRAASHVCVIAVAFGLAAGLATTA